MELEHQDLRDLAAFFAKRFPTTEDRAALARSAGLNRTDAGPEDPEASWFSMLAEADERRMGRLVQVARRQDPSDPYLQELGTIFAAPPRLSGRAVGLMSFAGTSALGLAALALFGLFAQPPAPAPLPAEEPVLAAVAPEPVPVTGMDAVQEAPEPELVEPAPSEPVSAEPEPVHQPRIAPVRRRHAPPTELPAPCFHNAHASGLVGYWYAGEERPDGSAGEQIAMPQTVNVRAEYPAEDNHWNARTEVRCVVPEGTPVNLGEAVRVPPGHWWIPLTVDADGVVGL